MPIDSFSRSEHEVDISMPLLHLISMKNCLVTLNLFKILFLKIMVERSNKLMNVPVDLFCEKQLSGLVRGK